MSVLVCNLISVFNALGCDLEAMTQLEMVEETTCIWGKSLEYGGIIVVPRCYSGWSSD